MAVARGQAAPVPTAALANQPVIPPGVTATDWLRAGIILAIAIAVALVLRGGARRVVGRRDPESVAGLLLGRALAAIALAAGLVYALNAVSVRLGPLLGALGVGGIAVAFALQDVLSNIAAGVILQVSHPFRRGEQITTGEYEGLVRDVNLRATSLRTYDGRDVYLPNSTVLGGAIVNRTRTPTMRTTLNVGLDYDTDLDTAVVLLREAAAGAAGVVAEPTPEAYVTGFGDSSISIAVRFWHSAEMVAQWQTTDEVARAVKRATDRAGVTLPFPQRVLSLRNPPPPAS